MLYRIFASGDMEEPLQPLWLFWLEAEEKKKKKKEIFRRYLGQKCIKQDTEAWNERREDRQKCTKWPLDL